MINHCDFLVIGSGPAGQKAAVQGAKAGLKVILIEAEQKIGGMCVHRGTIPSKALRESARRFKNAHRLLNTEGPTELAPLMKNVDRVMDAHDAYITAQLDRNQILCIRGRARFKGPRDIEVIKPGGGRELFHTEKVFVATGSKPRHPENISVDHEYVLDSDSVLSMNYLPHSMIVLGGGVIACEYASVFQSLGTEVTLVDRFELPLGFLDKDLSACFIKDFEDKGGKFIGLTQVKAAGFDGISAVSVELETGDKLSAEKLLVAQGRISNIHGLGIEAAGIEISDQQLISVNKHCQTNIPHIYAVGDVIGPPSLASSSMEQGRRAACHALGYAKDEMTDRIPIGIYAIPEMSSVGLTEAQAREIYKDPIVGYASFREVARGLIAGNEEGLLKIVSDPLGERLLGVHIVGEGAAELIHIGQMALLNDMTVEMFVEQVFNFPTLAEAYRVAALQVRGHAANLELNRAKTAM